MSEKDKNTPNVIPLKRAKAYYEISKDGSNVPVEKALFQHSALCQTFFLIDHRPSPKPHTNGKEIREIHLSLFRPWIRETPKQARP